MRRVPVKSEVHPLWWLAAIGVWFVIAFIFVVIQGALFPRHEPGIIMLAIMVYGSVWIARRICRRKLQKPKRKRETTSNEEAKSVASIEALKQAIADDNRNFEKAWGNLDDLSFNSTGLMLELAKSQSTEWREVDRYFVYNPDMGGENASAEPLRRGLIEIDNGNTLRMRLTPKGLKLMRDGGFMLFPLPNK